MSKILDWHAEQFDKEVFFSLDGKAAECINDMSTDDLCDTEKVFEKLDKTFLPKNYQGAVLEEFCSMKFKTGNKLSEFYKDIKVAYTKARPTVSSEIMEGGITLQLCKAIPLDVYAKCLSNFHLKDQEITSKYDEMISCLICDNYVEVDRPSAEAALSILKGTNDVSNKLTFDPINYYQYDSRPAN